MRILKPLPGTLPMPVHNIVGDWPMSSLGSNIFDLSGRGNNGVINGPAWADGRSGAALNFGANHNVDFGDILDDVIGSGFTFSIWLNLVTNPLAPIRGLISKSDATSGSGGFLIGQAGTGLGANKIVVYLWDGAAPSPYFLTTAAIPINQYVHLAVTWDGTAAAGSVRVYFNAILQAGAENNWGTLPIANNLPFRLGTYSGGARSAVGIYEDLQAYNRALFPAGIARLYRETFYRYPESRVFAVA